MVGISLDIQVQSFEPLQNVVVSTLSWMSSSLDQTQYYYLSYEPGSYPFMLGILYPSMDQSLRMIWINWLAFEMIVVTYAGEFLFRN